MTQDEFRNIFNAATTVILEAANLAAEAHKDQRRKDSGEPYINHPIRVARLAHEYELGPVAIAAALLHDTIEDTDLTHEQLRDRMGDEVAVMVHRLTKWWGDSDQSEQTKAFKQHYYAGILACPDTLCVKLLDRADNVADFARMAKEKPDVKWPLNYFTKTSREFEPLMKACKQERVVRRLKQELANLGRILEANGHTLEEA